MNTQYYLSNRAHFKAPKNDLHLKMWHLNWKKCGFDNVSERFPSCTTSWLCHEQLYPGPTSISHWLCQRFAGLNKHIPLQYHHFYHYLISPWWRAWSTIVPLLVEGTSGSFWDAAVLLRWAAPSGAPAFNGPGGCYHVCSGKGFPWSDGRGSRHTPLPATAESLAGWGAAGFSDSA